MTDFELELEQEQVFDIEEDNTNYVYFGELVGNVEDNDKLVAKFNETIDEVISWVEEQDYTSKTYVDNQLDLKQDKLNKYLKDASVSNDVLHITKNDGTQIDFQGGSDVDYFEIIDGKLNVIWEVE